MLLLLPLIAAAVLFAINVADYRRYRFITEVDKHLTSSDFEAMVKAVMLEDGVYSKNYTGADIPDVFKKIGQGICVFTDIANQMVVVIKYQRTSMNEVKVMMTPGPASIRMLSFL